MEWLQRAAEESGEAPVEVPLRPEVPEWLEPVLEAFYYLSSSRPAGFGGMQPLPVSEVLCYWDHFPHGEKDEFLYLIQQCDLHWLELAEKDKPTNG